jgi:hypothetical protein
MVNSGSEMLDDAKFENELQEMKEEGKLDEFTARNVYQLRKQCLICLGAGYSKKQTNVAGTVVVVTNTIITSILTYFRGNGGN